MYFCVRSEMPMMKTFLTTSSADNDCKVEDDIRDEEDRERKESWFRVKRNRYDRIWQIKNKK